MTILAKDLSAGDVITRDGYIDIHVTGIRPAICGFVVVEYAFAGGVCERALVAEERLDVTRPEPEEAH